MQYRRVGFYDLPFDIVYQIFSLAASNEPEWVPVVISHCCQEWREYSLNSPVLWSHITFRQSFPMRSSEEFSHKQKTWITRSKQAPLQIVLGRSTISGKNHRNTPTFGERSVTRILKLILPHCDRWESLIIDDIGLCAWKTVYHKLRNVDAFRLARLELYVPAAYRADFDLFKDGAGAPNIRDLKVGNGVRSNQWVRPIFRSLTSFTSGKFTWDCETINYQNLLPLLSNNPDLTDLTLTLQSHGPYTVPPAVPDISLPKLAEVTFTELVIFSQSIWEQTASFLLRLDAPNLTNIYPPHFDVHALNTLTSVPRIPFPKLQAFGIGVHSEESRDICPFKLSVIMAQLPHLRSFYLDYGQVPRAKVKNWDTLIITPLSKRFPLLDTLVFHPQYSNYAAKHPNACIEPTSLQFLVEERRLNPSLRDIVSLDVGSMPISLAQQAWFTENVPQFIHRPA